MGDSMFLWRFPYWFPQFGICSKWSSSRLSQERMTYLKCRIAHVNTKGRETEEQDREEDSSWWE